MPAKKTMCDLPLPKVSVTQGVCQILYLEINISNRTVFFYSAYTHLIIECPHPSLPWLTERNPECISHTINPSTSKHALHSEITLRTLFEFLWPFCQIRYVWPLIRHSQKAVRCVKQNSCILWSMNCTGLQFFTSEMKITSWLLINVWGQLVSFLKRLFGPRS